VLEAWEAFGAVERFVESIGSEDDIGFDGREMLMNVAEVVGAGAQGDFIAGPGEGADDEVVLGEALVKEGFELAGFLHALKEAVADEDDVSAGIEF